MKYKMLFAAITIAASASAAAQKVAEYGDPIIGNDYNDCTFQVVYGTGGMGYLYTEYEIQCPGYGTFEVGVEETWNPFNNYPIPNPHTCQFHPGDSSYYANGNCDNWRVYLN